MAAHGDFRFRYHAKCRRTETASRWCSRHATSQGFIVVPVYQYSCQQCGCFDKSNPMSMARETAECPQCNEPSSRYIAAPFLATSSRCSIKATSLNELAQNEPKHSSQLESKHKPGCSCCGGKSSSLAGKTMKNNAGDKMFPSKRPWMISH
ncbi:MAG: FmdB family zinc ribbon protein [Granulosicoccus sp.]